jgi:hypothetical protein
MGIFKVSYCLNNQMYAVQVMTDRAESAEKIILREHPEAVVIAVSVVA